MGSSTLTRDQTLAPALGVQGLSHWTTRKSPEDTKVLKDTCTPAITATLGTVAKAQKQTKLKGQMNG